jgi:hypothetical protein
VGGDINTSSDNTQKSIPEDDFKEAVEIIGWLYQYYNTEPKQAVFDGLKKNIKITKEKIPAATQLFTPDWIVRYMVENSLGRLWLEGHPNDVLKAGWKYYLDEAEQTPEVEAQLEALRTEYRKMNPEDIKVIDPCMGSGHILVYAFDVLMQIYRSAGYADRDAARLIPEKNLHGLDIDKRAYQLAYFAVMMKARQYDRRILSDGIKPQLYHPAGFKDGEEYGSLLKIDDLEEMPKPKDGQGSLYDEAHESALRVWDFKRLLSMKYDVVVTNPPYRGAGDLAGMISEYIKKEYTDSKSDLFAAFIELGLTIVKYNAFTAMITQHAWMFLRSFERFRKKLTGTKDIVNMAHLGVRAFEEISGEVVQATAFVLRNRHLSLYKGIYVRLVDIKDAEEKEYVFLCGKHRFIASADSFAKIPSGPLAYWLNKNMLMAFTEKTASYYGKAQKGLDTCDVDRFVRFWNEVEIGKLLHKWFFYSKGGEYRKWYGNNENVVNWENNGEQLHNYCDNSGKRKSIPRNTNNYFKPLITYSAISSTRLSMRYINNSIYGGGGSCYLPSINLEYMLAFFNSKVASAYLQAISPTMNNEAGQIMCLPVKKANISEVEQLVIDCISLSRVDWNSFETSYDFMSHPLI